MVFEETPIFTPLGRGTGESPQPGLDVSQVAGMGQSSSSSSSSPSSSTPSSARPGSAEDNAENGRKKGSRAQEEALTRRLPFPEAHIYIWQRSLLNAVSASAGGVGLQRAVQQTRNTNEIKTCLLFFLSSFFSFSFCFFFSPFSCYVTSACKAKSWACLSVALSIAHCEPWAPDPFFSLGSVK